MTSRLAKRVLLGLCLASAAWAMAIATPAAASHAAANPLPAHTFFNPIMDMNADPWMTQWHGYYYMTVTTGSNVTIWRSKSITNIASGTQYTVWSPSGAQQNFSDIWSPELHHFGNRWYLYFAADQNQVNATHRGYVLASTGANVLGPYRFVGEVHDPANQWMIDPNVLDWHGKLYFLWSGWKSAQDQVQRLFIAPMSSPTKINGPGVIISSPHYPWEESVAPINEGPVSLQHDGHTFIVYSANASWKNDYSLGLLTLRGTNPLKASDWVKNAKPVFSSANGVFGSGRASFVTSENGQQNWMIYHAARYNQAGWDRTIRAQPFPWPPDGPPNLGKPLPLSAALALPAGEKPNRVPYFPAVQTKTYALFHVVVRKAGLYGLYVRYRNGNGVTTMQNMVINGQPQLPLSIPQSETTPTQQDAYSLLNTTVTLPKGNSTIKIFEGPYSADIQQIQLTTGVVAQ